jgi:hypothetical protein
MSKRPVHIARGLKWSRSWELVAVTLLMWLIFISIPLYLGRIGLGWDGLNHQIYLGWVADGARFDKDYMAASLQAYQFPYLYWPVYKLAIIGVDGLTAGIVLATLHVLAVPPVWMIAKSMISGGELFDAGLRVAGVILGFMSAVPLKTLEATGNDFLAAVPMLWAIALAFKVVANRATMDQVSTARYVFWSGLLAGIAVACKLSNGPLIVLLPVFLLLFAGTWQERVKLALISMSSTLAGFIVVYGYWGYQLWAMFGNPLFPFYDGYWEPVRVYLGWHR